VVDGADWPIAKVPIRKIGFAFILSRLLLRPLVSSIMGLSPVCALKAHKPLAYSYLFWP